MDFKKSLVFIIVLLSTGIIINSFWINPFEQVFGGVRTDAPYFMYHLKCFNENLFNDSRVCSSFAEYHINTPSLLRLLSVPLHLFMDYSLIFNFLSIVSILLNFLFSYVLFHALSKKRNLSLIASLILLSSSYLQAELSFGHFDVITLFPCLFFLYSLNNFLKNSSKSWSALILFSFFLVLNSYSANLFFLLILTPFFLMTNVSVRKFDKLLPVFFLVFVSLLMSYYFLMPVVIKAVASGQGFIKNNYCSTSSLTKNVSVCGKTLLIFFSASLPAVFAVKKKPFFSLLAALVFMLIIFNNPLLQLVNSIIPFLRFISSPYRAIFFCQLSSLLFLLKIRSDRLVEGVLIILLILLVLSLNKTSTIRLVPINAKLKEGVLFLPLDKWGDYNFSLPPERYGLFLGLKKNVSVVNDIDQFPGGFYSNEFKPLVNSFYENPSITKSALLKSYGVNQVACFNCEQYFNEFMIKNHELVFEEHGALIGVKDSEPLFFNSIHLFEWD